MIRKNLPVMESKFLCRSIILYKNKSRNFMKLLSKLEIEIEIEFELKNKFCEMITH